MRARWSPAWLWFLVAVQLAIPASYYLVHRDVDDERFAWRMFSVVRLRRCEVAANERSTDGALHDIDVPRALHASWIRSLERGRLHVIERFLAQRCKVPDVTLTALQRRCKSPSGVPLADVQYRYDCAARRLEARP